MDYYAFRGIPFAEPPVGILRFMPPVPKLPWQEVITTIDDSADCVQSSDPVLGSEDCLTLDVYTTQLPESTNSLLPVMVYIYGGAFQISTSNYTDLGPDYLLENGVVVVKINYRIGILGFLSTGDLAAPGNNGLKDQILSLKWVRDNIRVFGGDPQQVTVLGQSAGSASISYLLQTSRTVGLFQKAIMESGVSLSLWAYSRHCVDISFSIGKDLGFDTDNSTELVESLKTVDYELLQSKAVFAINFKYLSISPREGLLFAPVLEPDHPGAVVTNKSHELLSQGQFHKIPIIIGFNSLEGTFEIDVLFRVYLAQWDISPSKLVPIDMNIYYPFQKLLVGLGIKGKYFGLIPIVLSNVNDMKFLGDDQFVRPIRETAKLLSTDSPVYLYRFDYEGGLWGIANRTTPGTTHSEELGYIWANKYNATPQDALVRARMVKMRTNFAKTGHPTPELESTLQNINWVEAKTSNPDDLYYLNIEENLELQINPENEQVDFWNNLYSTKGVQPYDTY